MGEAIGYNSFYLPITIKESPPYEMTPQEDIPGIAPGTSGITVCRNRMSSNQIRLSILVPVLNEEILLEQALQDIYQGLCERFEAGTFELYLCENGSTDSSLEIAEQFSSTRPEMRVEHLPMPSYGNALRHGISYARGQNLVIFNVDHWDMTFLDKALISLKTCDFVIGSKIAEGAKDNRPFLRRLITVSFNLLLRVIFGFRGTDTHGIKAMDTRWAIKLTQECVTSREMFDTEIVLRAQNAGLTICEIGVDVSEKRPSRYGLLRRVPTTMVDLIKLISNFWFSCIK